MRLKLICQNKLLVETDVGWNTSIWKICDKNLGIMKHCMEDELDQSSGMEFMTS